MSSLFVHIKDSWSWSILIVLAKDFFVIIEILEGESSSNAIENNYIMFNSRAVRKDKSRDTLVVFTSDNGAALVSKVKYKSIYKQKNRGGG